jgi:hypothetical protein
MTICLRSQIFTLNILFVDKSVVLLRDQKQIKLTNFAGTTHIFNSTKIYDIKVVLRKYINLVTYTLLPLYVPILYKLK